MRAQCKDSPCPLVPTTDTRGPPTTRRCAPAQQQGAQCRAELHCRGAVRWDCSVALSVGAAAGAVHEGGGGDARRASDAGWSEVTYALE